MQMASLSSYAEWWGRTVGSWERTVVPAHAIDLSSLFPTVSLILYAFSCSIWNLCGTQLKQGKHHMEIYQKPFEKSIRLCHMYPPITNFVWNLLKRTLLSSLKESSLSSLKEITSAGSSLTKSTLVIAYYITLMLYGMSAMTSWWAPTPFEEMTALLTSWDQICCSFKGFKHVVHLLPISDLGPQFLPTITRLTTCKTKQH